MNIFYQLKVPLKDLLMANKHMMKGSTSLAKKEMQTKTTLRFYLTPVRMAIINNINNNKCWQGCGEKEHFYFVGGSVN
jgi:Trm5-related predicted tRNA methylase